MEKIKAACPLNCYDVCGLEVTVEDNEIIKIDGDKEHPITKGKICGKGKMLKDRMYDKRRLLFPQKKVGNQFVRITWEQALSEISQKMLDVRDNFGAKAVLHSYDYSSGGLLKELDQRFFNFFGGMTIVKGSLCWGAGIQAQKYDFGDSLKNDVEDLKNAKTIIVWGRNITTTNMHLYPYLLEAKKNGTKIVVIDPIHNGVSKIADTHINILPGTDGVLAMTLSKVILDNNWHDKEFINNFSFGYHEYEKELKQINIDHISKEIKIEKKVIIDLARAIAQDKPVTALVGLGMQRYANGGNTIRAIDALFALTGNIGIEGGGVNYANKSVGGSFNLEELLREDLRKEYRVFYRPSQANEIIHSSNPPIKLMFISRSNALSQLPNLTKTLDALSKVETKVVMDMYMTETAMQADYVLPIASVFEEEDIYYGSMFHGIARYGPKIVEPPGEAWSDLKIWTELSRKLNLNGFEKSIDEFLEIALKSMNKDGINLEKFREEGQITLPIQHIAWKEKKFKTPSGKFEFYSESAKQDGLSPTPQLMYPKEYKNTSFPYMLLTIHPKDSLHSQHHLLKLKNTVSLPIDISKEVAEENNIENGDLISIYNQRGKLTGVARIQPGLNERTIVIEEGLPVEKGLSVNLLTPSGLSDMGNGSILYDCAVAINKHH